MPDVTPNSSVHLTPEPTLREQHLAETEWLAANLGDSIRIIDMRGYVRTAVAEDGTQTSQYLGAADEYMSGHIPGAIYLDWTKDIVDEYDPIPVQVASLEKLARVFSESGIDDDITVIIYDNHPALQFSTRLWWVLRYCGFSNVRVLNGGWQKWLREDRPVSTQTQKPLPRNFTPRLKAQWRRTALEVLSDFGAAGTVLVDARDEGQFRGKIRRGSRGGHIPGAISLPREILFTPDGTYKEDSELSQVAEDSGIGPQYQIVAYCNGGVAATSVLFALSMLGFDKLSNYDGSWNEWAERPELPVE